MLEFQAPPLPPVSRQTGEFVSILLRQHFLLPLSSALVDPNTWCFVIPKNKEKCSFIADMRNINELSKPSLPPFHLPTLESLSILLAGRTGWWGATLDLKNFYWSLTLPESWVGLFVVPGGVYDCLPFGWNRSPVIAQKTLEWLIFEFIKGEGLLLHFGSLFLVLIYLDDVLWVAHSRNLCAYLSHGLASFLTLKGLLVSPKSCLEPSQLVTWIGKELDLRSITFSNSVPTMARIVGLSLLAGVSFLTKKRLRNLLGTLSWAFRPRQGLGLFMWS